MKEKRIFDAITLVNDKYIEEAESTGLKKQSNPFKKWSAVAACALVAVGISGTLVLHGFLPFGGSSGGSGIRAGGAGTFMSYAGPVFPLSLVEKDSAVTAAREITYDFSLPREDSVRVWGADVTDSYTLDNSSPGEKNLEVLYPFAGSFAQLEAEMPLITVNGKEILPTLYAGGYPKGWPSAYGANSSDGSVTAPKLHNWEGYKALLADGSYGENALAPYPDLPQPVTVYTFTDFQAPEEYNAATQAISFTIDPDKTTVLTYGFEGGEFGSDGFRRFSYFVPRNPRQPRVEKNLLVLGEDIGDYTLAGYKDGACEKGNELAGVSVTISRSEEILTDVMAEVVENFFDLFAGETAINVPREMLLGAVAEFVYQNELYADSARDLYWYTTLEKVLSDVRSLKRVFYLRFPVKIPAAGSVEITANLHKDPNHDFACSGSDKVGVQGYDMVSKLGSNLAVLELTAALSSPEHIEIVDQNFGFDLPGGITRVKLDPGREHYYLEIKPQR